MTNPAAGSLKLCIAYDVVGYSRLSARSQAATQSRLARMLDLAFGGTGIQARNYEIQDQGDGGVAILTPFPGAHKPNVITSLIEALDTGLTRLNKDLVPAAQIRLRVSMAEGIINRAASGFVGAAIIQAYRILDSEALRRALAETESHLAVALTDALYRDAHDHLPSYLEFGRTEFSVKTMTGIAWIYLAPSAARLAGLPDRVSPADAHLPHSNAGHVHEHQSHTADAYDPASHAVLEDHPHSDADPDYDAESLEHGTYDWDADGYHSDPDPW